MMLQYSGVLVTENVGEMMYLFNWHVGDSGRCTVVAMSAPGWGRTKWLTTTRIHRHEELNIYIQIILESK